MAPAPVSLQSLRLAFKRAFTAYYLELASPGIADPTEAFAAAETYLSAMRRELGEAEFMHRLDDETTLMAGQVEQDIRRHFKDRDAPLDYDDLEDRLRECFEHGLGW
jgi:hypothetical protein